MSSGRMLVAVVLVGVFGAANADADACSAAEDEGCNGATQSTSLFQKKLDDDTRVLGVIAESCHGVLGDKFFGSPKMLALRDQLGLEDNQICDILGDVAKLYENRGTTEDDVDAEKAVEFLKTQHGFLPEQIEKIHAHYPDLKAAAKRLRENWELGNMLLEKWKDDDVLVELAEKVQSKEGGEEVKSLKQIPFDVAHLALQGLTEQDVTKEQVKAFLIDQHGLSAEQFAEIEEVLPYLKEKARELRTARDGISLIDHLAQVPRSSPPDLKNKKDSNNITKRYNVSAEEKAKQRDRSKGPWK